MNRPVRKNEDLHGNAPDSCPVILLLVDVRSDVDFPGNSQLLKSIKSLGKNICALKKRCKDASISVIYVNDNRGKWLGLLSQSYLTAFVQIRQAVQWSAS